MKIHQGKLLPARYVPSPNFSERPDEEDISLVVIHNISLPPGEFGGQWIEQFFTNCLDSKAHEYFATIAELKVSAHILIRRDAEIIQFVPFHYRAWHAGVSHYQGRDNCNDFSIGVELEGCDNMPYTNEQYHCLSTLAKLFITHYPKIEHSCFTGHADIAPGRKTDPGEAFDWQRFFTSIR